MSVRLERVLVVDAAIRRSFSVRKAAENIDQALR